ncbi:MAG: GNAT family N-acetyltransferase [Steroidobacter sp.]
MTAVLRSATRADIPGMHRVRMSVRENQLISIRLTDADYIDAIESRGRGWVVELDGAIVAFAVGITTDASIWALFVEPGYEGRGFGRRLHDEMVNWLWRQGHDGLWLTTDPGTRAQHFYEAAGWKVVGPGSHGEVRMELSGPPA